LGTHDPVADDVPAGLERMTDLGARSVPAMTVDTGDLQHLLVT